MSFSGAGTWQNPEAWVKIPPATYYGALISISYVLGGEELHPLRHLVAEAQEIVMGENGRVADGQVQSAATWTQDDKVRRRA